MSETTESNTASDAAGRHERVVMRFSRWLIGELTVEQFSVNHLLVAGFVVPAIANEHYLAAAIIYLFGAVYCSLMNKLSDA